MKIKVGGGAGGRGRVGGRGRSVIQESIVVYKTANWPFQSRKEGMFLKEQLIGVFCL